METINQGYGFSYALRPYLSSMLAALFMKIAAVFTQSSSVLLVASRLPSVLSITLCSAFCVMLGRRLFDKRSSSILFAVVVCFTPQVLFLGMYQNNDSLSLAAISAVVFLSVKSYDEHWSISSCALFAVAISVALLSYYTVYGWILCFFLYYIVGILADRGIPQKKAFLLKRVAIIAGICLLLAAWFFVRNALIHNGDFFGLASEEAMRSYLAEQGYDICSFDRRSDLPGYSIPYSFMEANCYWLDLTLKSMVAVFGNMDILAPPERYKIYLCLVLAATVLFAITTIRAKPTRRDALLLFFMVASTAITFALSFFASYYRDYQPQGRYVITTWLLIGYIIARAIDNLKIPRVSSSAHSARDKQVAQACVSNASNDAGESVRDEPSNGFRSFGPALVFGSIWVLLLVVTVYDTMSRMLL